MRGFAVSAVALSGLASAYAADVEQVSFKPTDVKGAFVEQFDGDWQSRWTPSEATVKTPHGDVFSYIGEWAVEEPSVLPSIKGDKGLVAKTKAAHHAISAPLEIPLDPRGKPFVVQYEAKFQKIGNCGGGYVKLLEEGSLANKEFSDTTPWVVMFGQDLTCPGSKVHFIFRHQNPITGEFEEKHLKVPPSPVIDDLTKLYTLVVYPDNTYNILINDELASEGNLLENFSPAVNPEKEIDDPEDTKPDDWVDEVQIRDPDVVKPDDWDESQPFQVVDEDAAIPEGWLVDEPTEIPDPEDEKPEGWKEDDDGVWLASSIKNPKCEEAPGCGPWKKPMKPNPLYKGVWQAPLIDNPAYKGIWAPRKISNPNYYEDFRPADLRPVGGVGFEIWTMTEDILFDNIYIGQSTEDAKALAAETWHVKNKIEKALKDKVDEEKKEKANADAAAAKTKFGGVKNVLEQLKEDPVGFVRDKVLDFVEDIQEEGPLEALKSNPQVGGLLLASLLTLFGAIAALLGIVGSSSQPVVKSTKKTEAPAAKGAAEKTSTDIPTVPVGEAASATSTATSSDSTIKKRK